jgi:hypothetical protein
MRAYVQWLFIWISLVCNVWRSEKDERKNEHVLKVSHGWVHDGVHQKCINQMMPCVAGLMWFLNTWAIPHNMSHFSINNKSIYAVIIYFEFLSSKMFEEWEKMKERVCMCWKDVMDDGLMGWRWMMDWREKIIIIWRKCIKMNCSMSGWGGHPGIDK